MSIQIYNSYKKLLLDPLLDKTIKVMLVDGYTADIDTHSDMTSIVSSEVTGQGYTAGGAALANKTNAQNNADDTSIFDADNIVWPNSTITASAAVFYIAESTPETSTPIKVLVFDETKESKDGDFRINLDPAGILTIS